MQRVPEREVACDVTRPGMELPHRHPGGILDMWHYCTREHRHTVWIEIYRATHWGFCYGCHRQHTWL